MPLSHKFHHQRKGATGEPTFFEQYPFQQRVLVAEHQTLIRCVAVTLLQGLQSVFMMLDRRLQLLDIFRSPLPESGLSLTIPLLPLFGGRINLQQKSTLLLEVGSLVVAVYLPASDRPSVSALGHAPD